MVWQTPLLVTLDGPPRGKGRPRFAMRGGRPATFTDAKTNNYEAALRIAAQMAMANRPVLTGPVELTAVAIFDVPRSWSKKKAADALNGFLRPTGKPDVDNIVKTVDALNGVVWRDDSQIVETTVRKLYGPKAELLLYIRPLFDGAQEVAA